mmetsp:Transcript_5222/g.9582  ORF Transcript_5222/g.9582 Transcript_5222/m.9582 type:complete len:214 (-) Transcript_5222:418-1059(-)
MAPAFSHQMSRCILMFSWFVTDGSWDSCPESSHLEESKHLLLGLGSLTILQLGHRGSLVFLRLLHRHALPPVVDGSRSLLITLASPIQPLPESEDGYRLLPLEPAICVVRVRFEPPNLLGTLDVRVVPASTALHVGDVLKLEFTGLEPLLRVLHRHHVRCLPTFKGLLEGLEGSGLESLGSHSSEVLGSLLLGLGFLELCPRGLGEAGGDVFV